MATGERGLIFFEVVMASNGDKREPDGIPVSKHMLLAILKWMLGIFIAGWMTAAIWIGTEIISRLDQSEVRLANLEDLNATQNTTIAVIQRDLKQQTIQQEVLIRSSGQRQEKMQDSIDRLKDQIYDLGIEIEKLKK